MATDYYKVLGIDRSAGEKDVRAAFRKLARKYHPDVNHGEPDAAERFKQINEAHEVLANAESRRLYDRYGDRWRDVQRGGAPFDPGAYPGGGQWRTQTVDPQTLDDLLGGGGHTIFDTFFGGGRHGGFRPQRPAGLEQPVEITLEEAFHGTTRALQVTGQSPCAACGGSGAAAGVRCGACLGQGFAFQPVRGEVSIPAGVDTGSRVRVSPGGQQVTLVVSVAPHPRFQRTGDDLNAEVVVPLYDAVLGAEVVVPTLTGQVALKLPPESQNGRVFRLGGQGMPRLGARGQRGNLFVTIKTELPTALSDEERRLFAQLRDLRPNKGGER